MPTISFFFGIVITMYWREHDPAHFDARYGEFEAIIGIATLEVIRGSLPRRGAWAGARTGRGAPRRADGRLAPVPRKPDAPADQTAGVTIVIAWNVRKLKVLPGYRLEVTFADGRSGVVDMSKDRFDGVLAPLADEAFFAQARIQEGAVTWPNGAEIAPDAMYDGVITADHASAWSR